jgi:ankyrin repeat protein
MHWAASNGHTSVIELLHNKNKQLINTPDSKGYLPVHTAAENGHIEVVRFFIEQDPTLLTKRTNDEWGYNPMHLAASNRHTETIKLLHST